MLGGTDKLKPIANKVTAGTYCAITGWSWDFPDTAKEHLVSANAGPEVVQSTSGNDELHGEDAYGEVPVLNRMVCRPFYQAVVVGS